MKRTWPVLLVLLFLSAPAAVQAQTFSCDGLLCETNADGASIAIIEDLAPGATGTVNIPTTINTLPVTSIGDGAFSRCDLSGKLFAFF